MTQADLKTTQKAKITPAQLDTIRQPHLLHQVQGPGAPRVYPLLGNRMVIGRDAAADIQVTSEQVSRAHARIEERGHELTCVDLDSSNGTYVAGVKVASAVLRDRDVIQLGDCVFEYRAGRG